MVNEMPLKVVKKHVNGSDINLDTFFGFVDVKVTLPSTIERPLLPTKDGGRTIFPTGSWSGVYFSEELKAVKKYIPAYKFEILGGLEFEKGRLFDSYVNEIYRIKSTTKGAERWIAKLLLNCLYGGFGRSKDVCFA